MPPEHSGITVWMRDFDTEDGYEYVELWEGPLWEYSRNLGWYTGSHSPFTVSTSSNAMWIQYHNYIWWSHSARGFRAEYGYNGYEFSSAATEEMTATTETAIAESTSVTESLTTTATEMYITDDWLPDCWRDMNQPYGTFNSPNYPNSAPNNAYCIYIITMPPEHSGITVWMRDFDTEYVYEYVELWEGPVWDYSRNLGFYTGSHSPFTVSTSSNAMWIQYYNSIWWSHSARGFRAEYGYKGYEFSSAATEEMTTTTETAIAESTSVTESLTTTTEMQVTTDDWLPGYTTEITDTITDSTTTTQFSTPPEPDVMTTAYTGAPDTPDIPPASPSTTLITATSLSTTTSHLTTLPPGNDSIATPHLEAAFEGSMLSGSVLLEAYNSTDILNMECLNEYGADFRWSFRDVMRRVNEGVRGGRFCAGGPLMTFYPGDTIMTGLGTQLQLQFHAWLLTNRYYSMALLELCSWTTADYIKNMTNWRIPIISSSTNCPPVTFTPDSFNTKVVKYICKVQEPVDPPTLGGVNVWLKGQYKHS